MAFDKNKFSFKELTMNANGKQSGSGFIGVITGLIACTGILATMVGYFLNLPNTLEVMGILLKLFGIVALLLGVRKVSSIFGNNGDNGDDSGQMNMEVTKPPTAIISPEIPKKI